MFKDQVVLVTGASSGIGRAIAARFGSSGAAVAVNYLNNAAGAEETAREIQAAGGRALVLQADVAETEAVRRMVAQTEEAFGPVDILVNNAGSPIARGRIEVLPEAVWDTCIAVNLKGTFLCSQAVLPKMRERKRGVIINISSVASRLGGAGESVHYATAKAAVNAFTFGLAKEVAKDGIRVNAIAPGIIDTPFHHKFSTPERVARVTATVAMGRRGHPAEVAGVVTFLASEEASYLTGQTIFVDGGRP
ncbi:MAG: SDR family NAD(P)-dependent oxidoreductase [Candidatus Methylomirabilales bacterium]